MFSADYLDNTPWEYPILKRSEEEAASAGCRIFAMYKNVLIVDSEANINASLGFLLEHSGFAVTTARDYAEAMAVATAHPPDLVLMDATLPDRSGYDLCQALLSQPGCEHLPVLMLTTRGIEVEREKALSLGAMDFIVKPFNPAAVLSRVQELLREAA
mgnify:CR=1 FL=1